MTSERGEVEVLLPVACIPDEAETRELLDTALREARSLVRPSGGRVLALTSIARAETLAGELAIKVRFLAVAPESAWPARRLWAVP